MSIIRRQRLFLSRAIILLLVCLVVFLGIPPCFAPVRTVSASSWDSMDTIAIIPSSNEALDTAAQELKTYLESMSGRPWTVVQGDTGDPAIRLDVNPGAPEFTDRNDEAVRIISDASGIRITGKTPIATRHGAYILLEKLGVRWFFKHPIWNYVPTSLVDIGAINEVHEPSYEHRNVHTSAYLGVASEYVGEVWSMRNRLWGTALHSAGHTYWRIIGVENNISEVYAAHPDLFLPEGVVPTQNHVDWQLKPDNPEVLAMAIEYARSELSKPPVKRAGCADTLPVNSVSISPNDGRGWDPPYSTADWQLITDKVFGLANEVAKAVQSEFPDKYVQVFDYDLYSGTPTFDLEPNLLVIVTNGYNAGPLTITQQVENMYAKGVLVGIRDYLDIWQYKFDPPTINYDLIRRVGSYYDWGARVYIGDTSDGWGGRGGLTNYLTGKLLWDATLDIDILLDDFYTKSFGPAKQTMKHYYDIRNVDDAALAMSFRDLDEAMILATGNNEILNRIRYLTYYNRYLWLWHNRGITNLSIDELKSFYTFITKTRDLYVVYYRYVEDALRDELTARGLTAAEIDALQDFTPPTEAEARMMLDEALAAFSQVPDSVPFFNPRMIELQALGDTSKPKLEPLYGNHRTILIPSDGNEDIEILVGGYSGNIRWYEPTGLLLDTFTYSSSDPNIWTPVTFHADHPGKYILYVSRISPNNSALSIDIPNRPASIVACPVRIFYPGNESLSFNAPAYLGRNEQYFYVPQGTATFNFGVDVRTEDRPAHGELTDPNGVEYPFNFTADDSITFDSPIPGVWRVGIDMTIYSSHFWLEGVPPLVWHDPEYLLIQGSLQNNHQWDLNDDGAVNVLDMVLVGQHWSETGPPGWIREDVNEDGTVNVLDMIIIGQNMTG